MKALVTGVRGFVGPHLVAHLEAEGDDVVGLDVAGPEPLDITDGEQVRAVVARVAPEVVYHLAALSHVGESWADPVAQLRVNVEGTLHVLRAAAAAGVARVVLVGSAEEYGRIDPDAVPVTEDAPLRPMTPYGAAKAAAEMLGIQAHLADGLGVIRVRAFPHTGPGQSPRFLVPALAARIAAAEAAGTDEITIGGRDTVRDLTDVRDVVRAYRLLAVRGTAGEVYNVCSGSGARVGDVAARLLALSTRPLRLVDDPALMRPVDTPVLVGSNARLVRDTGWAPQRTLDATLADVLDAARAARAQTD